MCREGAWDELAVRVTSGIAIRSGMLVKKSCRADMNICCTRLFCLTGNYAEFPIKQKHFEQTMHTRTRRSYCFANVLGADKKDVLLLVLYMGVHDSTLSWLKNWAIMDKM